VTERRADATTLDALAHHEAGHAVGFLVCRARFDYATIHLPGGGGVVAIDAWKPIGHPVRAVVSHAGPLAEARYQLGRYWTPGPPSGEEDYWEHRAYRSGADRDLALVADALQALDLTRARDPFQPRARELLRCHWSAVQRIAAALTEHHELTYTEVVDLAGELR
jgi:hypothetical protein